MPFNKEMRERLQSDRGPESPFMSKEARRSWQAGRAAQIKEALSSGAALSNKEEALRAEMEALEMDLGMRPLPKDVPFNG